MYHPTTSSSQHSSLSNEHADAITPSTWFVNFYILKPIEDTSLPSKLELLFLIDSGASICVLNLPTLLKCSKIFPHKNEFKTLIVANTTEVPIFYNVLSTFSLLFKDPHTCYSFCNSKHQVQYSWNPFFEKYVKTTNVENMSLTFNTPHESLVNTPPFTAHKEKD